MAIFALKSDSDPDSDCDTDSDADHHETFTEKELGPSLKDKKVALLIVFVGLSSRRKVRREDVVQR